MVQFTLYDIYETLLSVWMIVQLFFNWNMNYIRVSIICLESYHLPNFEHLSWV
jgi:hypothetical protein